jgi:hypothetical protein
MKVDQQQFVNVYIERQQRAISDLTNKIVMLETQLQIAKTQIEELEKQAEEKKPDDGFTSSSVENKPEE